MADPALKSILIEELKKRNLPVTGTLRVLQSRYDEALQTETKSVIDYEEEGTKLFKEKNDVMDKESEMSSFWRLDVSEKTSKNSKKQAGESKQNYKTFEENMNQCFNMLLMERAKKTGENVLDLAIEEFEKNRGIVDKSFEINELNMNEINSCKTFNSDVSVNSKESSLKKNGSNKVYIGNLPYSVSENTLERHCQQYGNVVEVIIPRKSKRNQGFGFVYFQLNEDAQRCIRILNGTEFNGRRLRVEKAKQVKIVSARRKMRQEKAKKKRQKEARKKKLRQEKLKKQKLERAKKAKQRQAKKNKSVQKQTKKRKTKKSVPAKLRTKKKRINK